MKKRTRQHASSGLGIFQNFLVNHLTAAGVSHIVTSQAVWKKWIWFFALWAIFLGMSYMTFQVVQEYLKYPSTFKTERKSARSLDFPAVTICGLNIIPTPNAVEAKVQYLIDLKDHLFNLTKYNISDEEKQKCRIQPLCHWSWTLSKCQCVASPCDTALCFPHDEDDDLDTCVCSMLICRLNDPEMTGACEEHEDKGEEINSKKQKPLCVCRKDFRYVRETNMTSPTFPPDPPYDLEDEYDSDPAATLQEKRNKCQTEEVKSEECVMRQTLISSMFEEREADLINYIRTSVRDDLQDIKRIFQPTLDATTDYGNEYDNIILSCSFGHKECGRKNFSTLFSPSYGKCFMFNYIGSDDDKKPIDIRHAGRANGLQLYLQTRKLESIDLLNPQVGMRVVVHDSRVLPFPSEHGIDIRPGDMSTIDVEYVNITRLGKPWGNCAKDGSSLNFNYNDKIYNRISCERKCMNEITYKRCQCYHPMFLTGTTILNRTYEVCDTAHKRKDDDCFRDILKEREEGITNCSCPPPCQETTYVTSLSAGRVNQEFFNLVRSIKSIKIDNGTPLIPNISDRFDIMGVRVYYKEMFFSTIVEAEAYSWQSLVANIGGNMGLFLGLSLVTFLEIFEFVTDLLWSMIMSKKKKKKSRKPAFKIHPKDTFAPNPKAFFTLQ